MMKLQNNIKRITFAGLVLLTLVGALLYSPSISNAAGSTIDTSICNTMDTIYQWTVAFPQGTIKDGVSPEFAIDGVNLCTVQFTGRIVSISTPIEYDQTAPGGYRVIELPGYPLIETGRDISFKPGVFKVKNKLNEHPVQQVTQMLTEMRLYASSSFDSTGALKPDAVMLATGSTKWTQTNFKTQ